MISGSATGDRARKLYAVVFLVAGVAVAAQLWGDRGPLLAVVAAVTFVTIAAGVLLDGFREWLRRRPYLDAFITFPAALAILAFMTSMPLATCLTIAAGVWLVLTITVTRRRQREQEERERAGEQGARPRRGHDPGRPRP